MRCWRDGTIPDLQYAVGEPIRITDDAAIAARVREVLPAVPTLTWGRDEERLGEMWSCNSIISWALQRAGIDARAIALPARGRAPGWDAGIKFATR